MSELEQTYLAVLMSVTDGLYAGRAVNILSGSDIQAGSCLIDPEKISFQKLL